MGTEIKLIVPENAIQIDRLFYKGDNVYIAKKTGCQGSLVLKLQYVSGSNYVFLSLDSSRQIAEYQHTNPRDLIKLMLNCGFRVYEYRGGLSYLKKIESLED